MVSSHGDRPGPSDQTRPKPESLTGQKEIETQMPRQRIVMLSLMAVFVTSMFTTAVASAEGPFWHVNGVKLKQGSVGITGQNKGNLKFVTTLGNATIKITCTTSSTEGTIDGQGETRQGQDKGKVTFSGCTVVGEPPFPEGCKVKEPITTNQLKSHLANATVQGVEQIVDLFEPTGPQQEVKKVFVILVFELCGAILNGPHEVTGNVAAQLVPQRIEAQEGLLSFPETPITTIKHEGQEVTGVGLKFAGNVAKFSGSYTQKLQNNLPYGVFNT
jgi:hypothetical protein